MGAQRKQNVKPKSPIHTPTELRKSDTTHKDVHAYFQLVKKKLHSQKIHILLVPSNSCQ